MSRKKPDNIKKVTLLPGHGIGPEVANAMVGVLTAAEAPIQWDRFEYSSNKPHDNELQQALSSIFVNRVAIKGPLETSLDSTMSSENVRMRKTLDLYANVVPIKNLGVKTRHQDLKIDMIVIRENSQGEYSGFESEVEKGVVQSLKLITERGSRRIAEFAFKYAQDQGRKKVTCIHKANIQKATDGMFLEICREVSESFPNLEFNDMIIDNACMQLVMNPSQFDVLVTPNLYGNIVDNLGAALVGGPGLIPGINFANELTVYEYGARHLGHTIAGRGIANPTGMISSACLMLKQVGFLAHADRIEKSLSRVLTDGKVLTKDLGGSATTKEFTQAVISNLED